jgi:hypothetical protein
MPTLAPENATRRDSSIADEIRRVLDALYRAGTTAGATGRALPVYPVGITQEAGLAHSGLVGQECGRKAPNSGPMRTIETGMAFALSTLRILEGALRGCGSIAHTAIDPYQQRDWDRAGELHLDAAGARGYVRLIEEDSSLALPRLLREGGQAPFDFAFLDGGHRFENVFADLLYTSRLVTPGGLIVLDDRWMPSVRAAAAYFVRNMGLTEVPADAPAATRFIALRTPQAPPKLAWDGFVPFTDK